MVSEAAVFGVLGALGGSLITGGLSIYRQQLRENGQNQRKRAEPFVQKEVEKLINLNKVLSKTYDDASPVMDTFIDYLEGEVQPPDKATLNKLEKSTNALKSAYSAAALFLNEDETEIINEYINNLVLLYLWAEFEYYWENENGSMELIETFKDDIDYQQQSDSGKEVYKIAARKVYIKELNDMDQHVFSDIGRSYTRVNSVLTKRIKSPIENIESE